MKQKIARTIAVRETRFENKRLTALGIEPIDLSDLRAKVSKEVMARPERLDFYILMLVTSGRATHTVDFVNWPLSTGTILFIRPGQVQQWHLHEDFSAHLVLIDPTVLPGSDTLSKSREGELLSLFEWHTCTQLPEQVSMDIAESMQRLQRDFTSFDNSAMDIS